MHPTEGRQTFASRLDTTDVDCAVLISLPPPEFPYRTEITDAPERLKNLMDWTQLDSRIHPFFWVDPLEEAAEEQVADAAAAGVSGFKIICNRCFPHDAHVVRTAEAISATGKPLLMHSGILWDGSASSRYNRPAEFEALCQIPGLRLALAHVSWPWTDEMIAVFGKYHNSRSMAKPPNAELYIDLTPGTPPCYRRDVLTRLFSTGYDADDFVWFGSDNVAADYKPDDTTEWVERDSAILSDLGLDAERIDRIFQGNLARFLEEAE